MKKISIKSFENDCERLINSVIATGSPLQIDLPGGGAVELYPKECSSQPSPTPRLEDCWAKTSLENGQPVISVDDHCFTVGYVAQALSSTSSQRVAAVIPAGFLPIIAAHDIGKITPGFQLKCPHWKFHDAISSQVSVHGLATNHALVSQVYLQNIKPFSESRRCQFWLTSTGAHHGSYLNGPIPLTSDIKQEGGLGDLFNSLRDELLEKIVSTFGLFPDEKGRVKADSERLHLLTGFTIFSDWLGSNTDWFPPEMAISEESVTAQVAAIQNELCLTPQIKKNLTFPALFQSQPGEPAFQPREIQQTLLDASEGPGLYIVEAPMGMGKTEAALAAAYKLISDNHAEGIYFALPTQLTSEKIHERVDAFLENILGSDAVQSLVHGNAWLSNDHQRPISPKSGQENNDTREPLRWYSSSRKALLAPFGTGTIDQALLAVLPARFAALRYFALAGKVVVIDEVHSFDPYMSALIDRLVSFLLKAGSTVIILSATLTAARRKELIEAAGASESEVLDSYPLITKVATGSKSCHPFPLIEIPKSTKVEIVRKTLTDQDDDYWQSIADRVTRGANVVVIRNTVALAQDTFRLLSGMLTERTSPDNTTLIHSRFPHWQRKEKESKWVARLGKNKDNRPKGSLVVSTQILEQSVDIDADFLVTDLAPIELILQRIGRLHRHHHERPAGFENAQCHILHPPTDWSGDANSIEQALAPHHFIYPPLALWQAARFLEKTIELILPLDIRRVLEASASFLPDDTDSAGVHHFLEASTQEIKNQIGTAKRRGIFQSAADDKEGHETRYKIKPSASIVLLKEPPQELATTIRIVPLHGEALTLRKGQFSKPLAKCLHENAVRISAYLVQGLSAEAPEWLDLHMRDAVLAVVSDDSIALDLISSTPAPYDLSYHPSQGITWEKTEGINALSEPEEDWF